MSACTGEDRCEIYRDKKYCKAQDKKNEQGHCNCRHARYLCEVERCPFREFCGDKEIQGIKETREALGRILDQRENLKNSMRWRKNQK